MVAVNQESSAERELVLTRVVDAPRDRLWQAWTTPDMLKQWFVPKPWEITLVELDLRPGGVFHTVMRSPEGAEYDNPGVCLEVVPQERLVFTDAYVRAWQPSEKPFMTAIVTMEDAGPARPAIQPRRCTGRLRTAWPTRRWDFTKAGEHVSTIWWRW